MNTDYQESTFAAHQEEHQYDADYELVEPPGHYGHDGLPRTTQEDLNELHGQRESGVHDGTSFGMPEYTQQYYGPRTTSRRQPSIYDRDRAYGGGDLYGAEYTPRYNQPADNGGGQYQGGPQYVDQTSIYDEPADNRGGQYQAGSLYVDQIPIYDDPADIQGLESSMTTMGFGSPETWYQSQGRGQTVKSSTPKNRRPRGMADASFEQLDSSFKTRKSDYKKFFALGRVFKTLWTEPYAGGNNHSQSSDRSVSDVSYGEKVFSKIRRFVVIRYVDRYCICLPVTTYDGRGLKKRGINLSDHGLIYTGQEPESPPGITLRPVKLLPSTSERMADPSYVNYARCYSIETNIKVKDGGRLSDESCRLLYENYKTVQFMFDVEEQYPLSRPDPSILVGIGAGLSLNATNAKPADDSGMDPQILLRHRGSQTPEFERIARPARWFVIGRVFKVQWAELAGSVAGDGSPFILSSHNGEQIFQKIRHFVVVRQLRDHCLCLPLNTYDGQGALKYRVDPADYAAVFAAGMPEPDTSAEQLQKSPFPIKVEADTETIDPMSRINFGRVYTVEYNLRVANVGRILPAFLNQLDQYFVEGIRQRSETIEQEDDSVLQPSTYPTPSYEQLQLENDDSNFSTSDVVDRQHGNTRRHRRKYASRR
jgi:hypothetical protein